MEISLFVLILYFMFVLISRLFIIDRSYLYVDMYSFALRIWNMCYIGKEIWSMILNILYHRWAIIYIWIIFFIRRRFTQFTQTAKNMLPLYGGIIHFWENASRLLLIGCNQSDIVLQKDLKSFRFLHTWNSVLTPIPFIFVQSSIQIFQYKWITK